jgi:hypothetical protein
MALERQPAATGAELVKYSGAQHNVTFTTSLVGQGIASVGSVPKQVHDGEIVWKLIRQETDELGMTHSFYRQVLVPAAALATGLAPSYQRDGIELAGSEIGIHLRADGSLRAVFGTQYRDAVVAALPTITSAAQALAVGLPGIASWPGFVTGDYLGWTARMTEAGTGEAKLLLKSTGDGTTFRPVWQVVVSDDEGVPYIADLDAATGAIVSVTRAALDSNCSPTSTTQASASGLSQSGCNSPRSIKATLASDRQPTFTHEATWPGDGVTYPTVEVYFSIADYETGYSTYMCPTKWYGILPVKTVSGTVTYDDWTEVAAIPGKAAADAVKFTRDTMYTLKVNLGRFSYNGSGGAARVVLNGRGIAYDNAYFKWSNTDPYVGPLNSVGVSRKSARPYLYSSCLDVIAHEWGHGVITTSANFDRENNPDGAQLHEGFADFIGHATEWYRQPAGTTCEKAEWKMGEDNGSPTRRVDTDDGVGGYTLHKDDEPLNQGWHARGNMLGVAFRLLDIGGQNPVCGRLPGLSGCTTTVNNLGLTKSSKILFRVLTVYANSNTHWEDLVDLATWSAFDLYARCGSCYEALTEQQAAYDAFKAIGYAPDPYSPDECISCP